VAESAVCSITFTGGSLDKRNCQSTSLRLTTPAKGIAFQMPSHRFCDKENIHGASYQTNDVLLTKAKQVDGQRQTDLKAKRLGVNITGNVRM